MMNEQPGMNSIEKDIINLCLEKLGDVYGQPASLVSATPVGGGCINHALRLTCNHGEFFLKWNASCADDMFPEEALGLEEMGSVENPFLIVPKVIRAKATDELPGYLLMEYLKPSYNQPGFDERLGHGLAVLHQKTADKFGFHHNNYCGLTPQQNNWNADWRSFFAQQRIWHLVELIRQSRGLTSEEIKLFEKLVDRMPQLLPQQTVPSLIHGDLWSGNYMYTEHGSALIDPACYYTDREMEFSIMLMFGGFSQRVFNSYNELYPLPADWSHRNPLYQLYHILNHYYLFGGHYRNQAVEVAKKFL